MRVLVNLHFRWASVELMSAQGVSSVLVNNLAPLSLASVSGIQHPSRNKWGEWHRSRGVVNKTRRVSSTVYIYVCVFKYIHTYIHMLMFVLCIYHYVAHIYATNASYLRTIESSTGSSGVCFCMSFKWIMVKRYSIFLAGWRGRDSTLRAEHGEQIREILG